MYKRQVTNGNLATFKWSDNFPRLNRKTTLGGLYIASIQNVCGITSNSILLNILKKPFVNLGSDTVLCPGETVDIRPILGGTYNQTLWNDLSPLLNRTIDSSQKLWFTVQGKCGSLTDTIQINYSNPKPLFLANDTSICNKDTLFVNINSLDFNNLIWKDGYQGYSRSITKAGNYKVDAFSDKCKVGDDFSVAIDYSPYFNGINDTIGCINMPLVYQIDTRNIKILWDDGETSFTKNYLNSPGKHWVEVSAKCGQKTDSFHVSVIECVCNFWIPTAITPGNGDMLNDLLEIKYDCKYQSFHLEIFNRWGEKLWETNNPKEYWDGTSKGTPLSLGAYFWIAFYVGPKNGIMANYIQKGTLTIVK